MKCISLWQPWATLVVTGHKLWETRVWNWTHRGPLLIHAAKHWDTDQRLICDGPFFQEALAGLPLPRGAILGCVNVLGSQEAEIVYPNLVPKQQAFGDFNEGRWAMLLSHPHAFEEPIPYSGKQGFFDVDPGILPAGFAAPTTTEAP